MGSGLSSENDNERERIDKNQNKKADKYLDSSEESLKT